MVQEVELRNYGQLLPPPIAQETKSLVTFRLRQNRSEPNLFASRVQIDYDRKKKKIVRAHTNGFLSRSTHSRLVLELNTRPDLLQMAEWLYNCDYGKLIATWYPIQKINLPETTRTETETERWSFHHLHSRSKSQMMQEWATELNIEIEITKGSPGFLKVSGTSSFIGIFKQRFECLHWKQCSHL